MNITRFNKKPATPNILQATRDLLTDSTKKLNRAQRERLLVLRSTVYTVNEDARDPIYGAMPVAAPVKLALKLSKLPLVQVLRRQRKFAREASTAKHLLAKLSGFSAVRTRIAGAQDAALAALGQVTAEIKARALVCKGQLGEAK